jgi:hypothetical protein
MTQHPELAKLPLSARVTHTSGLPKNIGANETAGEGRNLYTQIHFARSALRDPRHQTLNHLRLWKNKIAARRIGAMFVTSDTGALFVANWQGSLTSGTYGDLRRTITSALH